MLRPAPGIALAVDQAAGWTYGVLAKKGAGKTYTGRVMAEEFHAAGIPFCVLDPTGAWWGLRAAGAVPTDGSKGADEGLPVVIFGGEHADVPLEPTAGKLMADLLVEDRIPMVLDLSGLGTRAGERRFAHDFLDRLYRRNRELVHLFVDEADLFAPQKPAAGDQPLLGVMENLVRRGRIKGIGVTLISQRAAVLNKDVLTQLDVLVAMRIVSPQDRSAIGDWIRGHDLEGQAGTVLASLASLANGESWWWIPELDILERTQVRAARTYDSSPTPRRTAARKAPRELRKIDLDAIAAKMADTIERAKADDPRELRRRITQLEKELATRPTSAPVEIEVVREVLPPAVAEMLARVAVALPVMAETIAIQLNGVAEEAERAVESASRDDTHTRKPPEALPNRARGGTQVPAPSPARPAAALPRGAPGPVAQTNGVVTPARQRILDALASLEAIGVNAPKKIQLALFAGASPKSSGYTNNLGALRSAGYIDYPVGGHVALTDDGRDHADSGSAPASQAEMIAFVQQLVGPARSRILTALLNYHPQALSKGELAVYAGVSASSSGFTNNLGSLRSLGLIDYPTPGNVALTDVLFV